MALLKNILSFIWMLLWFFFGIGMLLDAPDQMKKDKEFIKNEIKPSFDFVNQFKRTYNRLPTNREYYTLQREYHNDYSSDLSQKDDSKIPGYGTIQYIRNTPNVVNSERQKYKDADWSKDFAIAVWRGEWFEYYFSWSDTYDTNNFSLVDAFISLFVSIIIGCIPLMIRKYKRMRQKKLLI